MLDILDQLIIQVLQQDGKPSQSSMARTWE